MYKEEKKKRKKECFSTKKRHTSLEIRVVSRRERDRWWDCVEREGSTLRVPSPRIKSISSQRRVDSPVSTVDSSRLESTHDTVATVELTVDFVVA